MAFQYFWSITSANLLRRAIEARLDAGRAPFRRFVDAIAQPVKRVIEAERRSRRRREAHRDLSRLGDHILADIGLTRNSIVDVVEAMDRSECKPAEQLDDLRIRSHHVPGCRVIPLGGASQQCTRRGARDGECSSAAA